MRYLWILLVGLSACSIVEVRAPGQAARVERYFGITQLELRPEAAPVVTTLRSFGFVASPLGATLGYADQVIVALPPDCGVVFWIENPEQAARIQALLHGQALCPAGIKPAIVNPAPIRSISSQATTSKATTSTPTSSKWEAKP